jgi:hypothetical protein
MQDAYLQIYNMCMTALARQVVWIFPLLIFICYILYCNLFTLIILLIYVFVIPLFGIITNFTPPGCEHSVYSRKITTNKILHTDWNHTYQSTPARRKRTISAPNIKKQKHKPRTIRIRDYSKLPPAKLKRPKMGYTFTGNSMEWMNQQESQSRYCKKIETLLHYTNPKQCLLCILYI